MPGSYVPNTKGIIKVNMNDFHIAISYNTFIVIIEIKAFYILFSVNTC